MSNCKVIALTNQKGGVGKTTTAVNLGVSLAQQGKKVLLIDADAQANLTMSLGYNRPDDLPVTLSTIMQDIIEDNPIDVQKSILHHGEGVDLLPSNIELSGLEVRLINAISRESVLKTCVNEVKKNYDYVLVDCMPSLGMLTINALAAADSVVIPTQPHYLSAKGLELLLRSVSKVKRQINPPLRIDGILMTMVMPRTNISKEITATVRSAYGQKIKVFDKGLCRQAFPFGGGRPPYPQAERQRCVQQGVWHDGADRKCGRNLCSGKREPCVRHRKAVCDRQGYRVSGTDAPFP